MYDARLGLAVRVAETDAAVEAAEALEASKTSWRQLFGDNLVAHHLFLKIFALARTLRLRKSRNTGGLLEFGSLMSCC